MENNNIDIRNIINKKRNKVELKDEEIRYFIQKYTNGEVLEAQAGALLSYIYLNGLTDKETLSFSLAMANSGDKLDLSEISDQIVDKHSTGGVGDKVTLILMPLIASLGLPVAKISSRGFGISGGTIDKLESIPGFNTEISLEKFEENIKDIGVSIINQTYNLAPAEKKMYRLRSLVSCADCLPIVAASLMSLKLASGSNKIVFDLTCGRGTYIKNKDDAKKLGKMLVKLGNELNKKVGYVITSMEEPLGNSIGHILEIKETIRCLRGNMPQDIGDVVVALGSVILELSGRGKNLNENSKVIIDAINSGKALMKFKEMVAAQGGDIKYIEEPESFAKAKYIVPVYSTESGNIKSIDADVVGSIARYLGAGRMKDDSEIDKTAGIILEKKIGQSVESGGVLAYIHTNDENKVLGATQNLKDAFKITNGKVLVPKSRVLDIM